MMIAIVLLGAAVVGFVIVTQPKATHQRLEREATPEELAQIRTLLRQGKEIAALKAYRVATSKSLKEAQAKIVTLKD